jgi:hypothetical protein
MSFNGKPALKFGDKPLPSNKKIKYLENVSTDNEEVKVKVKVKLSLCLTKHHTMETK